MNHQFDNKKPWEKKLETMIQNTVERSRSAIMNNKPWENTQNTNEQKNLEQMINTLNQEQKNQSEEKYKNRVKNIKKCVEILVKRFFKTNSVDQIGEMYEEIDELYEYYFELSDSDVELVKMIVNRMTK